MRWSFAFLVAALPAVAQAEGDAETCAAGLDRTLAVMEARPLMKEEEATGLMWLRLDAQVALERGDVETCLEKLGTVEIILGVAKDDAEG
jgi:hypothetical protein